MKEAPIAQENTADPNAHEHSAVEIPACPVGSPLRRNAEAAPAEPSGSWTRRVNPAGIWSEMRPAPYANPTGRIDWITQITQEGSRFIIDNPEDSGGLTAGARAAVLRHSVETGMVSRCREP